ncbi:SH3 domain-containing protein [Treponema sp. TIM-1]
MIINSIVTAIASFFFFIVNNILVIGLCVLLSFSFYLLVKQFKKRKPVIRHKFKKPQKLQLHISKKINHPLYDFLLNIIKNFGSNVFSDVQQCRGLLKDFAKNEYNEEIKIFNDLLLAEIPRKIMHSTGKCYYNNFVHLIFKKNFSGKKHAKDYEDEISLLVEILSTLNLLDIKIRDDSEKPLEIAKRFFKNIYQFTKYYTRIMFYYIKNNYKIIIPSFLMVLFSILLFFSYTYQWRAFNKISYPSKINYKQVEQTAIQPVKVFAYVSSHALNMRSGPSISNSIITQLKQNSKVEIISVSEGWSLVIFDGYRGYVNSSYLENNPVQVQINQSTNQQNAPAPAPKLNLEEKEVKERE